MDLSEKSKLIYKEIEKIDAHMHLNYPRPVLQQTGHNEGFEFVTINTDVPEFPPVSEQQEIAVKANRLQSPPVHFITTFTTKQIAEPGWQEKAIHQISQAVEKGAVGVKIWKNIGMELQDQKGKYIMPDHAVFDPVYDYLAQQNIPLLGHLGEPKNCWLPLHEMTVLSDKKYFEENPEYHMHLHRGCPSYKQQLRARDRMLAKHPDLIFIGAHLASLEWSVERLASWLDRHPGCGADLAERVSHLQYQAVTSPDKIKNFVQKYQDRIIYGSDTIDDGSQTEEKTAQQICDKWHSEFRFFADDDIQTAWNVRKPFRGLGLDKNILQKIFRENAIRYYPGIDTI